MGESETAWSEGAYTGEVSPRELHEVGARVTELGHAERRRLFGEDDELTNKKVIAAIDAGLLPVICVGETERMDPSAAADATLAQVEASLAGAAAGPVVLAYEPVWAIGAPEPAPKEHIVEVTRKLQEWVDVRPERDRSSVIYGGSAGPGLLTELGDAVDGLFLGRFAHDPDALMQVIDEAASR